GENVSSAYDVATPGTSAFHGASIEQFKILPLFGMREIAVRGMEQADMVRGIFVRLCAHFPLYSCDGATCLLGDFDTSRFVEGHGKVGCEQILVCGFFVLDRHGK